MLKAPILMDCTLRDGQQAAGVYFTNIQIGRIFHELKYAGVGIVEAGIPVVGKNERDILKCLVKEARGTEVWAWCRSRFEDIRLAYHCGVHGVHISVPVTDRLRLLKSGLPWHEMEAEIVKLAKWLNKRKISWSLGLEDASRSRLERILRFANLAQNEGAVRIRYADTLGVHDPFETFDRLFQLSRKVTLPWDFHGHNDRGMANANAMAAWKGGAKVVSCTLGGLGERAGNVNLEEFAYLAGILLSDSYENALKPKVPWNLERLNLISKKIAFWSGRTLSPQRPFFGEEIHNHESGIHVAALLKDPEAYDVKPILGSRALRVVPGKSSGRQALIFAAQEQGFEIDSQEAEQLRRQIQNRLKSKAGLDTTRVFEELLCFQRKK